YRISFLRSDGLESNVSGSLSLTPTAGRRIQINAIPVDASANSRTIARRIYRQVAGGAWTLIATLNDNTTRTYIDRAGAAIVPTDPADQTRAAAPENSTRGSVDTNVGSLAVGRYEYRIAFVDSIGREGNPSVTVAADVTLNLSRVLLEEIPLAPFGFDHR